MNRITALLTAAMLASAAVAQTLNVNQGQVTYSYAADSVGDAAVTTTAVTIGSHAFSISDITNMQVVSTAAADANTVSVTYSGTTASVVISGNLAGKVTAKVNGAHVALLQGSDVTDEVNYTLTGTSTNGSFYMDGSIKATVTLNGVTLTNPDSCAINIQDGKRIAIVLASGTTNTLTDGLTSVTDDGTDAHKAALYVQGHTEYSGGGALVVNGMVRHGIVSHEYCELKASLGSITVAQAASDGLHMGEYLLMRGGTLTINATGDGIDVGRDSTVSVADDGKVIINGGTLTATVSGPASDALKCDSTFTLTAGTVKLLATGAGGRALNVTGDATISGGYLEGICTGALYGSGTDDERKAHAFKAKASAYLSGGQAYFASASRKGIDCDALYATGASVLSIGSKKTSFTSTTTTPSSGTIAVTAGSTVSYYGQSLTLPSSFTSGTYNVIAVAP